MLFLRLKPLSLAVSFYRLSHSSPLFLYLSCILLTFSLCSPILLIQAPARAEYARKESFMFRNDHLIEKTVEITVAKLSNTSTPTNESNGKNVAEFMQEIYDKLVELNKED